MSRHDRLPPVWPAPALTMSRNIARRSATALSWSSWSVMDVLPATTSGGLKQIDTRMEKNLPVRTLRRCASRHKCFCRVTKATRDARHKPLHPHEICQCCLSIESAARRYRSQELVCGLLVANEDRPL